MFILQNVFAHNNLKKRFQMLKHACHAIRCQQNIKNLRRNDIISAFCIITETRFLINLYCIGCVLDPENY